MDSESTLKNIQEPVRDAASPFDVGQLLDGKYEIVSFLGKGGMGSVYRVKHVLLGVELALKTLDSQNVEDAATLRRFQTEARAAFSLKHPGLVKVHDYGVLENGHPFLVMDLVKGRTLQSLIKERGHLSLSDIESIFVQLCFALAHAHHQSVVHRDIKPANIMLVDGLSFKEEGSVKILDFGIAKLVNQDRGEMEALTMTGEIFGSPLYMSPEQCSGASIDQRSDVYSLGCVLFEALTGTTPLVGNNPLRTMMLHVNEAPPTLREAALGSEFPEGVESIVAKMLAKNPSDRYSDLGVVAHELCKVCSGTESQLHQPSQPTVKDGAVKSAPAAVLTFTLPQLALILFPIAIASILVTHFVDQQFHAGSKDVSPVAEQGKSDANPVKEINSFEKAKRDNPLETWNNAIGETREARLAKLRLAFNQVKEITPKIVDVNGKRYQQVTFPEEAIGNVVCFEKAFITLEAKGTLRFPITTALTVLEVSEEKTPGILSNAKVFEKVDPGIFRGLFLGGAGDGDTLARATKSDVDVREEDSRGAEQVLKIASGWKLLDSVQITNLKLTEGMCKTLNGIEKLKQFRIIKVDCDPLELPRQKFLRTIQALGIETGETDALLNAVSISPSIKFLDIGKVTVVSTDAIKNLKKNKQLEQINLGTETLTNADVKAACDLPQISRLSFQNTIMKGPQRALILEKWIEIPLGKTLIPINEEYVLFGRRQ